MRFDHLLVELQSSTSLFVELRSSLLVFITATVRLSLLVFLGKEPVVELENDKVVEKLVLVHMEKAAFLSALVGSEVAYSAAQATVATLSEAYETTKNHRSFPRNTSLQGENGEYLWLKIMSF
ncbi:hypothetical protein Ahy_B02g059413 [Arachis hypogaea]|uniref:Uncharacterized protein n=1 Tax=Arachis hypogaea TaxID=3818 RepID=A0A445AGT7_ARAHY|nr:hypothetical protein Ahy_B02g059413 [Arachis hypogaea]